MKRLLHFVWHERMQIFLFLLIGGLSFLLSTGLYLLFSRFLWPTSNGTLRTLENFFAIILASIFNFLAHRLWTFAAHQQTVKQLGRYTLVGSSAIALQTFLFWFGHQVLGMYDLFVIVVVTGMIAFYTFCLHRWFTFRKPKDVL